MPAVQFPHLNGKAGLRGGSWTDGSAELSASYRSFDGLITPMYEDNIIGFRVAEVPEPAALLLLALGGLAVMRRRGRCHARRAITAL